MRLHAFEDSVPRLESDTNSVYGYRAAGKSSGLSRCTTSWHERKRQLQMLLRSKSHWRGECAMGEVCRCASSGSCWSSTEVSSTVRTFRHCLPMSLPTSIVLTSSLVASLPSFLRCGGASSPWWLAQRQRPHL